MKKPVIGITLGDVGGVGPQIVFQTINKILKAKKCHVVLFGAEACLKQKFLLQEIKKIKKIEEYKDENLKEGVLYFVPSYNLKSNYVMGKPDAKNGKAAYAFITMALDFWKKGKIDALVTAPICKESFFLAGINYTGHTTLLEDKLKAKTVSMAFYTPKLKTVLVTIHKALKEVPKLINEEKLRVAFKNSLEFARLLGIKKPKIALSGLNPHAGEAGAFGDEEQKVLIPFVKKLNQKSKKILGPFPADSLYFRAARGDFDIVISLYHDQGLIPIKLLGFYDAVNVSLGLPIIRTSPDHGTAFDIAYKKDVNINSFLSATNLAIDFWKNKNG